MALRASCQFATVDRALGTPCSTAFSQLGNMPSRACVRVSRRCTFEAMLPVLEAVPNFSEGRDPEVVEALVDAITRAGAQVLDWSRDPDHHRCVVTYLGDTRTVEEAAVSAARIAIDRIDLRKHRGVHPRVGALDVLPIVPMAGASLDDAVEAALRTGRRLAEEGLPVYFYGAAREGSRTLAEIRRGGFEALADGFPVGREPDMPASGALRPHPSAGVSCVGARHPLLAWNVYVEGLELVELERIAAETREAGGGFRGLRALALELPTSRRRQISMNLEDLQVTSPLSVFRAIETNVKQLGGRVVGTEVIGMIPDGLVLPAAEDTFKLLGSNASRLLSARLAEYLSTRVHVEVRRLLDKIEEAGARIPASVRNAAERLSRS